MPRKLIYVFGFILFIIGFVPLFIDFSDYAAPYLKQAQISVGRSIKTGTIRLQILPTPRLKINQVVLGNVPNATTPDMVKIENVEVILSLFELLKGKIVVKSVWVNQPEVNLEKFKNNETNWNFKIAQQPNQKPEEITSTANAAVAGLFIKQLNIANASVNYVDHNDHSTKSLANINITSVTDALLGPYKINISLATGEANLDLEVLTDALDLTNKTKLQANLSVNYQKQKIHSNFEGFVNIYKQEFGAHFTAASTGLPFTIDLPNQKIDWQKTIDAKGEIHGDATQVTLKNLKVSSPFGSLTGAISYNLETSQFSTDLNLLHQQDLIKLQCTSQDFEEFSCQLSSTNYQGFLKLIGHDQIIKGAIDVRSKIKLKDALLVLQKTAVQIGDASSESDIQFNTATKVLVVHSKLQSIQRWGQLFGYSLPFKGTAVVDLNLTPEGDITKITKKLMLDHGSITFEGRLGKGESIASGRLTAKQFAINDLNVDLKTDVHVTQKAVDLDIQNIHLQKSGIDLSAGGKISVDLTAKKPRIVGTINAQPVQLAAYQNQQVYVLKTLYYLDQFKFQLLSVAANSNSRWSSEPINMPLNDLDLDLKIDVPAVTLSGLKFEGLQSKVVLANGKLSVPFAASLYGGKLSGTLQVEGVKQSKLALLVKFDDIAIAKIPAAAAHFSQGKASGAIELHTLGRSQHDFVGKLQGKALFLVNNGIVKGFDLHKIIEALKKPKNLLDFSMLQSHFSGKGETAFSKASGNFVIQNGIASTNDLSIEAKDAVVKMPGQLDMINWQMQFNGEIVVPDLKDLPPLKFTIKGPIDQPSYQLDFKQIQQLLIKSGVGKLVEKSIPGLSKIIPGLAKPKDETPAEAANANQPAPDKLPNVDKVVGGLLKGIFGK